MDFLLSLIIFSPFLGALVLLVMPRENVSGIRRAALVFSLLPFLLSMLLWSGFDSTDGGFQFIEDVSWVPRLGIRYIVAVDGISLFLVLLTTFLTPLVVLSCWEDINDRIKEFFFFLLTLEMGMLGAFLALDLFLFYVFWEVMLVPMYFIIGVWGGPRRIYAAIKFVLYTMAGSLLMLVAIIYLASAHAPGAGMTFDLRQLYEASLSTREQLWLFTGFALAFAIKVPLFPFHTWLPDAHVEAPTGGSVILAGVLLKLGTYGFLRFAIPLFPDVLSVVAPVFMVLAVIGIIYGAAVAMVQPDLKKLVAYSSVSHLGFVMLGLFAFNRIGVEGAIYQMLNHGLSTGGLFLVVGVIYSRRHTRMISDFGGLWREVPCLAAVFMVITLSSIGLPGLNGFVGEFLILLGTFKANRVAAIFAVSGIVLGAVYMLWMYQRVMFGPVTNRANKGLHDLTVREMVVLAPVLAMIVVMGVYPRPFLKTMEPAVKATIERLELAQQRRQADDGVRVALEQSEEAVWSRSQR